MSLIICRECGSQISDRSEKCVKCGAPTTYSIEQKQKEECKEEENNQANCEQNYAQSNEEDAIRLFTQKHPEYYLKHFNKIKNGHNKISWNWFAFLFPGPWLFYRKLVKAGIILDVIYAAATLWSASLDMNGSDYFILPIIIMLAIAISLGLYANYIYLQKYNSTQKIISKSKESDTKDNGISRTGSIIGSLIPIGVTALILYFFFYSPMGYLLVFISPAGCAAGLVMLVFLAGY